MATSFHVRAAQGKLLIRPGWAAPNSSAESEFHLKGANWGGFESRFNCPEQLNVYSVDQYIAFLNAHKFNAVRFPLSDVTLDGMVDDRQDAFCGEYSYWRSSVWNTLEHVIGRLANAGVFVVLCMHTMSWPLRNNPLWCSKPGADGTADEGCALATHTCASAANPASCRRAARQRQGSSSSSSEEAVINTWIVLARRFCSQWNVIAADVFNEPCVSPSTRNAAHAWRATTPVGSRALMRVAHTRMHARLFVLYLGTTCLHPCNIRAFHPTPYSATMEAWALTGTSDGCVTPAGTAAIGPTLTRRGDATGMAQRHESATPSFLNALDG